MYAKCFVVINTNSNNDLISQFTNPSQRDFLLHELKSIINNMNNRSINNISDIQTSNGVWYYKYGNTLNNPNTKDLLFVELLSKEVDYRSAGILLNNLINIYIKGDPKQPEGIRKLKNSISQTIKLFNANKPGTNIKAINSNVAELQDMMRGNVNKLVQNVSDLEDVEKKSERLSEMSLTFQNSARDLQRNLARKKLIMRIVVAVVITLIIGVIVFAIV